MKTFFLNTAARLKSKFTPYFKRWFIFMASLTGLGATMLGFKDALPEKLQSIPGYLLTAGAIGAYMSRLPSTDPKIADTLGESIKEENI